MTHKFYSSTKTYENWLKTHPYVTNEGVKNQIDQYLKEKGEYVDEESMEIAFRKNGEAVVCRIDFKVEEYRILLIRGHVIRFFKTKEI